MIGLFHGGKILWPLQQMRRHVADKSNEDHEIPFHHPSPFTVRAIEDILEAYTVRAKSLSFPRLLLFPFHVQPFSHSTSSFLIDLIPISFAKGKRKPQIPRMNAVVWINTYKPGADKSNGKFSFKV